MKATIKHLVKEKLKITKSVSLEIVVEGIRGIFIPLPAAIAVADIKELRCLQIKPLLLIANSDINYVVLPSFQGSYTLLVADILYIVVIKNYIYIKMRDTRKLGFKMTLGAIGALLLSGKFCMAGRSCLVNIAEIVEIESFRDGCATMSNAETVKVGRGYFELLSAEFVLQ